MRKIFILGIVFIIMLFLIVGCGGGIGIPAEITIHSYFESSGSSYSNQYLDIGETWLLFDISMMNLLDETIYIDSISLDKEPGQKNLWISVKDPEGREYLPTGFGYQESPILPK